MSGKKLNEYCVEEQYKRKEEEKKLGKVRQKSKGGGNLKGVVLTGGQIIFSSCVILTTGTFLGGKLFIGSEVQEGGTET